VRRSGAGTESATTLSWFGRAGPVKSGGGFCPGSVLGIVLAAALAAGFLLTRDSGVEDELPVSLDLMRTDGQFDLDGLTVTVTAEPRPLRIFDSLRFAFRFTRDGQRLAITDPLVDFDMVMDMGPHEYRLVPAEDGAWVADDVVLPQCGSGSRLWFARLTFEAEGSAYAARLRLDLDPPRSD
jgi:hypothetical protein